MFALFVDVAWRNSSIAARRQMCAEAHLHGAFQSWRAANNYLPPVLPPTPPACARLSPGGPPICPLVGPLSRLARPGLRLSWSAVGSLIIGSLVDCLSSAGPPFVICAYAVVPDSMRAVAAAIVITFIAYLHFWLLSQSVSSS